MTDQGTAGKADGVYITKSARRAVIWLLLLVLVVGAGNLWASYAQVQADKAAQHREQVARQHAGEVLGRKLCTTFGKLAALKPPPGDPTKNPSRAFEQQLHDTLVQLGDDLGCKLPR